ncbi:alpha/beta hydrolase [Streptomyces sp. NPDC005811]|uniref:alpha/beta hydrolase n=1 Tax=Streptomyces sp. NPDC005811 TaxID=3154565 RepID=UPI0033D98530
MNTSETTTALLVHGAWHSPGCWSRVTPLLDAAGVSWTAVELPSVHGGEARGDMYDDAETIRQAIRAIDGPVTVVAHSYGGVPATEGAAGEANVANILYVASFVLGKGDSLLGSLGGKPADWWVISEDGTTVTPATPTELFYADCPEDIAAKACADLTPQRRDAYSQPLRSTAWADVPTTYLVCDEDAVMPVFAQEAMATAAGARIRRIQSSHSPFLSRPEEFTGTLLDVMREGARG